MRVHRSAHVAAKVGGTWVVPVCSWYHFSFDREPALDELVTAPLDAQPYAAWDIAGDRISCKWPEVGQGQSLEFGSEAFAQYVDVEINRMFDIFPLREELQTDLRQSGEHRPPIISFSHFLPRQELLPEKRFLFHPNLAGIVGSDYLRKRVDELNPDVHIFGHTHFAWDMHLPLHDPSRPRATNSAAVSERSALNAQAPGRCRMIRYRSWPLGNPREQARRRSWFSGEEVERWWPVLVFDSAESSKTSKGRER